MILNRLCGWEARWLTAMLGLLLAAMVVACSDPPDPAVSDIATATPARTAAITQPTAVQPIPSPEASQASNVPESRPLSETPSPTTPSGSYLEVCSNGLAVPEPKENPGLVQDCASLLAAANSLEMNWDADRHIKDWSGVTTLYNSAALRTGPSEPDLSLIHISEPTRPY